MASNFWGGDGGSSAKPDPPNPANPAPELPPTAAPGGTGTPPGPRGHPQGHGTGPLHLLGDGRGRSPPQAQLSGPPPPPLRFVLLPRRCRARDEPRQLPASARARVFVADMGKVQIEPPAVLVPAPRSVACPAPAHRAATRTAAGRAPAAGRHRHPSQAVPKTIELCQT